VVGVTEDGAEDCKRSCVVEDCAKSDGGGLDWWEVWRVILAKCSDTRVAS
jgi:hypothetical protein